VPVPVRPNQNVTLGGFVLWSGVTAVAGIAFSVKAKWYGATTQGLLGNLIQEDYVASVSSPAASTVPWVNLTNSINAPTGAAFCRLTVEVSQNVSVGDVWFDDCSVAVAGMVDASLLGNIENIPMLLADSVQGFSGLLDMFTTFAHMVDGLGTAYNLNPVSGLSFSDLFSLAQTASLNAFNATNNATNALQILGIRNNSAAWEGLHPTSEATYPLVASTSGTTDTTTAVAPGNSIFSYIRTQKSNKKGFFEFRAYGGGNTGGVDTITQGATGAFVSGAAGSASLTEVFTPAAAGNSVIAFVAFGNASANNGITATYTGPDNVVHNMTQLGTTLTVGTSGGNTYYLAAFRFDGVPAGAANIVATPAVASLIKMNVLGFANVSTYATPVTNTGSGTALSSGAVASGTNHHVVQCFFALSATAIGSYTARSSSFAGNWAAGMAMTDQAGAASTTITGTATGSGIWGSIAIDLTGLSSASGVYANIYKTDASGNKTLLYTSPELSNQIPAASPPSYVKVLIPNNVQPSVVAGDLLHLAVVNNSSTPLNVVTKTIGAQNHPTDIPTNVGGTRAIATTGGISPPSIPASLASGVYSHNGIQPWVNLGLANIPPGYQPPQTKPWPTHGTYTFTPSTDWPFITTGDFIDLVGVGAGGGGSGAAYGNATGSTPGGSAGIFQGIRLIYGVDIKVGSSITITVGTKGAAAGGWSQPGGDGTSTVFTWTDPSNATHTMTCAFGAGGPAQYLANNTGYGPGTFMFQGIPYYGGSNVGGNTPGSAPGGGGGGGVCCWSTGIPGADGEAWARFTQQAAA
jgi:hypothetical protein